MSIYKAMHEALRRDFFFWQRITRIYVHLEHKSYRIFTKYCIPNHT